MSSEERKNPFHPAMILNDWYLFYKGGAPLRRPIEKKKKEKRKKKKREMRNEKHHRRFTGGAGWYILKTEPGRGA